MKRFLTAAALAVALVLPTVGCGVLKDDVAATVDGEEISVGTVAALARTDLVKQFEQDANAALVASTPGTIGATSQRTGLNFAVQAILFEKAAKANGDRVTSDDRAAAESLLAQSGEQGKRIDPAARMVIIRWYSGVLAFRRALGVKDRQAPAQPTQADYEAASTPDKVAAYAREHLSEIGEIVCLDGFAVPKANAGKAQAAVDAGQAVSAILADTSLAAQSLSQTPGETCLPSSQILNPDLAPLTSAPLNTWGSADTQGQTGETFTIFIQPKSRKAATADDPTVVQLVTAALQQQVDADYQAAQQRYSSLAQQDNAKLGQELSKHFARTDVDIDPRYGRLDPAGAATIVAPPAPKPSAAASAAAASSTPGQLDQ